MEALGYLDVLGHIVFGPRELPFERDVLEEVGRVVLPGSLARRIDLELELREGQIFL